MKLRRQHLACDALRREEAVRAVLLTGVGSAARRRIDGHILAFGNTRVA